MLLWIRDNCKIREDETKFLQGHRQMSGSSGFSMTFDADLDFQTDVMSVSDRAISMNILHRSPWRYTSGFFGGGGG